MEKYETVTLENAKEVYDATFTANNILNDYIQGRICEGEYAALTNEEKNLVLDGGDLILIDLWDAMELLGETPPRTKLGSIK